MGSARREPRMPTARTRRAARGPAARLASIATVVALTTALAVAHHAAASGDTSAPQLLNLSIAPATIDTSLVPTTITVTTRLADDLSGVSNGSPQPPSQLVLQGPTGSHRVQATFGVTERVSGSANDGIYATTVTVPRYAEQGAWSVASFTVVDNVGNQRVYGATDLVGPLFAATFTQTGAGDINAPHITQFAVAPTTVDAT